MSDEITVDGQKLSIGAGIKVVLGLLILLSGSSAYRLQSFPTEEAFNAKVTIFESKFDAIIDRLESLENGKNKVSDLELRLRFLESEVERLKRGDEQK